MLNHMVLMGRMGADPELNRTQDGKAVCSIRVAVDRNRKNADGGYDTDWFRCVAWNQTAELIARSFCSGDLICLDGHMQTRSYTDKNGIDRDVTELLIHSVYFTESKASREARRQKEQPQQGGPYYAPAGAYPEGAY